MRKCLPLSLAAAAAATIAAPVFGDNFASQLISYSGGDTYPHPSPSDPPANHPGQVDDALLNSQAALNFNGDTGYGALTPFNGAYDSSQLVGVGQGGSIEVKFANPVSTNGYTIGIHAGVGLIDLLWPSGSTVGGTYVYTNTRSATVEVSQDGATWVALGNKTFDNPSNYYSGGITLPGYQTVDNTLTPADFTKPFIHPLSDFDNKSWSQISTLLDGSAGGTWLDLSGTGLASVNYIRFTVGTGNSMYLDAVSGVPVDATPYVIAPSEGLPPDSTRTIIQARLTTSSAHVLKFNLVTPNFDGGSDLLAITESDGLVLNGGTIDLSNHPTGASSLGFYKVIQYSGAIGGAGLNSITLPATQNNIAYTFDTIHDPGYIDIHRGFIGDINDSGTVDLTDLTLLAANWQKTGGWAQGDMNGDGLVDLTDLTLLAGQWQQGIANVVDSGATLNDSVSFQDALASLAFGQGSSVPEPATLSLLALSAIGLFRAPPRVRLVSRSVKRLQMNSRKEEHSITKARGAGLPGSRGAFTLIELLVVVAIMTLLIAILLPSMANAREQAKSTICLSNLRELGVAAQCYTSSYDGLFPLARDGAGGEWDFLVTTDGSGNQVLQPGILWQGNTNLRIQQCPSYTGRSPTITDPYTGYNYNTSFVGKGAGETPGARPARFSDFARPGSTAIFGDGFYYGNVTNKYMRSPQAYPQSPDNISALMRAAGTQGYRHQKKTNVSFGDAHAEAWSGRSNGGIGIVSATTGFLAADDSVYDYH